jgi:hypothetical protein
MDLPAPVTACALTIRPKLMHPLIWEQSGGEPWSFSMPGGQTARLVNPCGTASESAGDASR